ncbi:formate dehydrogenase subunit gamma [Mangrovicoccus algicola]|uniref:Formate dehydrogenase subunit gamma n=1 Tax=Mangrovicoccus algicola TaxID=2771008 RepID=A0A8J7CFW4_9RHOB|nr:formate dehydrogenase subunit gamma [Mangrovicoccus algicola]MBE3636645.1 formate dehydrogenase subunit gamma [Mangrovicoccus algicola]
MPRDFPQPTAEEIDALIHESLHLEGPLLPIFHALQDVFGHVPEMAIQPIAEALNITRAEVHGVMSFYHDFRKAPAGRHVLKICRAEACQSMGANALAEATLARLGLDWHGTTANGNVTVEPVYCLGLCACAPAVMIGDRLHGRVDGDRMDAILKEAGA